ncbi:MAG TPA: DNA-directed RNA polymerase subunit alpha, partial [Bacillota bacterium]
MLEIAKPVIEAVEQSEDGTYGRFVVEPLERGYGITLGNSLRRILLSSLPGAAVTSVKIEGVLHEFSTIPGVVEDTTEIILNLKGLALQVHADEPQTIRIEAEGPREVYARDIRTNEAVEVVNPDHYLCTLEEGGRLVADLTVRRGRGYVPADRNKQPNQPIGVIPVDSIFTPIRKVNFRVEDTRVGNITDYDKLTLEVWTNGTIRPDEAISLAAKIMVEHLNLF